MWNFQIQNQMKLLTKTSNHKNKKQNNQSNQTPKAKAQHERTYKVYKYSQLRQTNSKLKQQNSKHLKTMKIFVSYSRPHRGVRLAPSSSMFGLNWVSFLYTCNNQRSTPKRRLNSSIWCEVRGTAACSCLLATSIARWIHYQLPHPRKDICLHNTIYMYDVG